MLVSHHLNPPPPISGISSHFPPPFPRVVSGNLPETNVRKIPLSRENRNTHAAPNAVVTPLHKAASYEKRIAILGIWGGTWLTRGKHGIYAAVCGSYGAP